MLNEGDLDLTLGNFALQFIADMCPRSTASRRDFPIVTDSFGQLIDTETWHCLYQTIEEIWPFWEYFWHRCSCCSHILAVIVEINGHEWYIYKSEEAMYFSHLFYKHAFT